jgi:hypothetical protein
MKIVSDQAIRLLAALGGWTYEFAKGYRAGQSRRVSGTRASAYALVAIDEYGRGFRAGYFGRERAAMQSNVVACAQHSPAKPAAIHPST